MANPGEWVLSKGDPMSYEDEDNEEFDGNDTNLVKKLRAKIDELSAKNKELEAEYSQVKSAQRQQTLAELLTARGYAPKVAKFVPDSVEITDEGVDGWLSEYGDAFTPVAVPEAEEKQQQTIVVSNAAQAESIRRMSAAESGNTQINANDVLQRIQSAQNMDELVAALRSG